MKPKSRTAGVRSQKSSRRGQKWTPGPVQAMDWDLSEKIWDEHLKRGLKDDGLPWDWTTLAILGSSSKKTRTQAKVIAKEDGVWVGEGLSRLLQTDYQIKIGSCAIDGEAVSAGQVVCEWEGSLSSILALERTFLNLTSYASGIATQTARAVELVRRVLPARPPRIVLTRKTLPFYRDLAVWSVLKGGGGPHRTGLSSGVLIKENHITAACGIRNAVTAVRNLAPHGLRVEVEVTSLDELKECLRLECDAVLLDNFAPEEVEDALGVMREARAQPLVEVSGGIHLGNLESYLISGVDIISMGGLTHSVKGLDLSLLLDR